MMAYASWSVVFGEQPSAAKWNILGSNDASFNDGTGLPNGVALQCVSTNFSAVSTGTTTIPWDDTIPQITEGNEYMTQAITPKSTTDRLIIEATLMISNSVSGQMSAALFQDATANAIAVTDHFQATATGTVNLKLTHTMLAGTTSSTTFRVRAGAEVAGTTTFNGNGGGRKFGGITISNITVREYKA